MSETHAEMVIRYVTERGDILCDVDGFWKFWPSGNGYFESHDLEIIAKHLKEKNAEYEHHLELYFIGNEVADHVGAV